jgi:predicted RNA-binding Zn ribbon-like protein
MEECKMTEFYGDHPALDLINTVVQGTETWHSDADVMQWLKDAGFPASGKAPHGLLEAGRGLRETVRALVHARKHGHKLDVARLNGLLAQSQRHLALHAQADGSVTLQTRYATDTPERLLAPLAESAAQLLADGDFNLIRKCEDHECTLWFLDRTKSHRRRWCSMALCGNRNKVASFRQRQKAEV